jgi:hypothetical protein
MDLILMSVITRTMTTRLHGQLLLVYQLNFKISTIMKKSIVLYLFTGIFLFGCDDFLDVQPKTLTIPEIALNTESDIVTALHGAYSYLNDDGYGMMYNVIADASTDSGKVPSDVESAGTNPDRIPYAYSLALSRQFTADALWTEAYQAIAAVNNILTRLEAVEFDPAFEAAVSAECLALRALLHFSLTQIFAQDYNFTAGQSHLAVPYLKETNPGANAARNTMSEVYADLMADVNTALQLFQTGGDLLTSEGYRQGSDIYFMNSYATLGLRARLHFYSTNYQNALADANSLLAGPFTLVPEYTLSQQDMMASLGISWISGTDSLRCSKVRQSFSLTSMKTMVILPTGR